VEGTLDHDFDSERWASNFKKFPVIVGVLGQTLKFVEFEFGLTFLDPYYFNSSTRILRKVIQDKKLNMEKFERSDKIRSGHVA
jgi:hypothetical protein